MVQVINGNVVKHSLPHVGTLSDGRTVSGYHLLGAEILKSEGWLPLEDTLPEYDSATEHLIPDGYDVFEDRVVKKYRIEEKPKVMDLELEVQTLKETIDYILGIEPP